MTGLAVPASIGPAESTRGGPGYWAAGYRAMIRWHLAGLRMWLPMMVALQVLAGAGFVLGIALFFDRLPPSAALYVSTGVPVINLMMVGLILGPQLVAQQKIQHTYEFLQSLPVPRTATAMAWYTVTLIGGLPAVVVSLAIAVLRYDLSLDVSPAIVPAILLTTFAGTMMGYALAHAIGNPMTTQLVVQVLIFVVFGYSPILFPEQQMPGWLATVNWWLPFQHMAVVVRDGLTTGVVHGVGVSYLIVSAWGLAGAGFSARALGRRR